MPLREWMLPAYHPMVLFIGATIVPGIVLAWLGWQLLREDQALESRRLQERLENAADGIAAALDRQLADYEDQLGTMAAAPDHQAKSSASRLAVQAGEDAVVVLIDRDGVEAYPKDRLLYYPWLPGKNEPRESVFADGEAIELRQNDPAGACAVFRKLARSSDPGIRAGALLRLARSLRKAGKSEMALAVYDELAALGNASVRGIPAELLARQARCNLLGEMGRTPELNREARSIYSDLQHGRWMLSRTAYKFHSEEARRRLTPDPWLQTEQDRERERLALAEGVDSLWVVWKSLGAGEGDASGRRGQWLAGGFVSLAWRSGQERLAALVTGPLWAESQGLEHIRPVARRHGVSVILADSEGRAIGTEAPGAGSRMVIRNPAETRLPWTLHVASLDPLADVAEIAARRRMLLAAFAVMATVVVAGSCFMARAVTRELEAARLKSDFVAAVSHEFRTPLASMCQIAELFADGRVPEEKQQRQYYGLLVRETRRLRRLVENLLDFARMEGGAREYRMEPLDAAALVRDTVSEFQEEAAAGGYRIELHIGDAAIVQADGDAIRRALWNLLDNAVKYSPECRTVWVELTRDENRCRILVRDQGMGISSVEQKRIFTKFARGPGASAAGVKGTGIGLSMVDHIVRAHRGKIRVESEPGRGSTFEITLPLAK